MITSATLAFLSDLDGNNERAWFEANKKRYEAAKKEIVSTVGDLISGLTVHDGQLAGLNAKDSLFRIFRDVRFSHNKAPYKTNMGAWMAPGGRKSVFAGYYFHVEPGGKSFLAGGCYMPEAPVLKSIRDDIDYQPEVFSAILEAPDFKRYFKNGLEGERLRTAPKGYEKDNPAIEYLKHKSFVVTRPLTDAEVIAPDFLPTAIATYAAMVPLTQFLTHAISAGKG
jgi:uncharacterized protein (TIGR02453 family)